MRRLSVWISILVSLTSCVKAKEPAADTASPAAAADTASPPVTAAPPAADTAAPVPPADTAPAPSPSEWVVTPRGIGKLRAGMTIAEARAVLPGFKLRPGADPTGCDYAITGGLPAGVTVMVEQGKVARVDVARTNVPTSVGAGVGDSEERIKTLYPNRVAVSPHKYTDGHYLTVTPAAKADSAYRVIFETDGKKVVHYRAGIRPQVEYVEGCS